MQKLDIDLNQLRNNTFPGISCKPMVQTGSIVFDADNFGFFIRAHDAAFYRRYLYQAISLVRGQNEFLSAALEGLLNDISEKCLTELDSLV